MFKKTIELTATKKEFLFTLGMNEVRFRPIVYLAADKKIVALGSPPVEGAVAREARVLEDGSDDSFILLEAMLRYGMRKVSKGRIIFGRPTVRLSLGADIRADLKGFAPGIFQHAAMSAGAGKVDFV